MKDFKKLPKMACGGSVNKVKKYSVGRSVQSYEEAKKSAPSDIRVPKAGEPSNYRGYGWASDTREQAAKTAKSYFDANNEGMKSSYERSKEKGDPSSEEISKRLGEADEEAAGIMQRALRKEDKGRDELYKLRRETGLGGYKKGGKVKGPSLAVGRGEKLPTSQGAGLTAKGRAKYNRETGSNLKAPQPEGGPRKKSFCARMSGMPGPMKDENGKPTRKAASLKRWKCGS